MNKAFSFELLSDQGGTIPMNTTRASETESRIEFLNPEAFIHTLKER
jgi:hypothetical protein